MSDQDSRDEHPVLRDSQDQSQDPDTRDDDLAALDAFCDQVDFQDVGFSEWQEANTSLDILLTEAVSLEEARCGGDRTVHFSRTISRLDSQNRLRHRTREKVSLTFSWPPGITCPYQIVFEDKGDQRGKAHGRVIIKLLLKK